MEINTVESLYYIKSHVCLPTTVSRNKNKFSIDPIRNWEN